MLPIKSLFPKGFLFRLTYINTIVIALFIVLSSWAIYNTACTLVDGLVTVDNQKQAQFEATLFQYLWIFSVSTILIGSVIHFYLTKKLIHPIRELIDSTKLMKQGHYPIPINVKSKDEVGQLNHQFNDLVQQLKENQQYKQKLVADLSHEFRTPLTNLNGYLYALQNGVIEADEKLYQSLYEESNRLSNLVEQMEQLKAWDYVSEQTFSEKEPVDIEGLVEQSVNMFHWTAEKKNIEINVNMQPGAIKANIDGISQVISNLMDNAIRYYNGTEPITISGEAFKSEYRLSITGPGQPIPATENKKIFDRFYRVDPSRTKDSGGTGLGLAISKEIIEHHHGEIGVTSDDYLHTFWFTLPIYE